MLSKSKIKYLNALQLKKFRQKYNNFMVEGDKIVREVLQHANSAVVKRVEILEIFALPEWIAQNAALLKPFLAIVTEIDAANLRKISALQTPNQVLLVAQPLLQVLDPNFVRQNLTLVLDELQDPGNLGTVLRIADWFGIANVVASPNCADLHNPKTLQASMGAFLRVNYFKTEVVEFCQTFADMPIYGAVLGGDNLFKTKLLKPAIIVIGNEGNGISEAVQNCLTHRIEIPANGQAESLNAAIAAGIICAVFVNQG
jgi:RNA methyltransferase, TrmH family